MEHSTYNVGHVAETWNRNQLIAFYIQLEKLSVARAKEIERLEAKLRDYTAVQKK